jgi:hypothetical protein
LARGVAKAATGDEEPAQPGEWWSGMCERGSRRARPKRRAGKTRPPE